MVQLFLVRFVPLACRIDQKVLLYMTLKPVNFCAKLLYCTVLFARGKLTDNLYCNQAAVFHYGSISLLAEPCRSAHLRAMEIAKEAGALLSYDPNPREAMWPSHEEIGRAHV